MSVRNRGRVAEGREGVNAKRPQCLFAPATLVSGQDRKSLLGRIFTTPYRPGRVGAGSAGEGKLAWIERPTLALQNLFAALITRQMKLDKLLSRLTRLTCLVCHLSMGVILSVAAEP